MTSSSVAMIGAAPETPRVSVIAYVWSRSDDQLAFVGETGRMPGLDLSEIPTGAALAARIEPIDRGRRETVIAVLGPRSRPFRCSWRLRGGDGQVLRVEESARTVEHAADGTPSRIVGTLIIRALDAAEEAARRGRVGRTTLMALLERAIEEAARSGRPGVFLVLELHDLSLIHDAHDVATVDAVVDEAGRRIAGTLRATDSFARLATDQFGVLLPDCPAEAIPRVAEKLLATFRGRPIAAAGGTFPVALSLGLTALPHHAPSAAEAIARAEGALRQAKRMGRDCFAAHADDAERRAASRAIIATGADFVRAAEEDRLFFAYQPIVDTRDRSVVYHECLLRMRLNDGRIVVAGAFVPTVERLGLARTLDRLALRLVMTDLARHPKRRLAINISAITTGDRSWLDLLRMQVERRPDIAGRLIVEVTETAVMHDIASTGRFLDELRSLGCQTSLDDFGAGHTSFRHLTELPFDIVKLDGSLTRGFMTEPVRHDFVRAVVALAHSMGRRVVAEYVESAEELAKLRDAGVDHLQGYFLGAPAFQFAD